MTRAVTLALLVVVLLGGCVFRGLHRSLPPNPITYEATARGPDGNAPDAATMAGLRDLIDARLRYRIGADDLPVNWVTIAGDRTIRMQLATDDDFDWEVSQRLRPGRVQLRPVRAQLAEPADRRDISPAQQPRPQQLATMPAQQQYDGVVPNCDLLIVRDPGLAADPSKPIAACYRSGVQATKYLLDPAAVPDATLTAVHCVPKPDSAVELTFDLAHLPTGPVAVVLDGVVLGVLPAGGSTLRDFFVSSAVAVLCATGQYRPLPVALDVRFS